MKKILELGEDFLPQFDKDGLLPAIVQDYGSKKVLMLAYMNEQSLRKTLQCGEAVYYSRSRRCLWHKGKTSGAIQKVVSIAVDCDQDTLLLSVIPAVKGACHNGYESCFYRDVISSKNVAFNTIQKFL